LDIQSLYSEVKPICLPYSEKAYSTLDEPYGGIALASQWVPKRGSVKNRRKRQLEERIKYGSQDQIYSLQQVVLYPISLCNSLSPYDIATVFCSSFSVNQTTLNEVSKFINMHRKLYNLHSIHKILDYK